MAPPLTKTKVAIGISGILALAFLLGIPIAGTALFEFRAYQQTRREIAAAGVEIQARSAALQSLEVKVKAAEKTRAELDAEAESGREFLAAAARWRASHASAGGAGGSSGPGKAGGKDWDPVAEGQKFLNAFPELRPIMIQQSATAALKVFAPFMRNANLTEGQQQQFENLIASNWLSNLVLTPTQMGAGAGEPSADQLTEALGDQGPQEYQDYLQNMRYPYAFTGFAAAAAGLAGVPLSDSQTDQVAQIIASNAGPYQLVPGTVGPGNWNAASQAVNWDAAIAQIQAALPPSQYNAVVGELQRMQLGASLARQQQSQAPAAP